MATDIDYFSIVLYGQRCPQVQYLDQLPLEAKVLVNGIDPGANLLGQVLGSLNPFYRQRLRRQMLHELGLLSLQVSN